MPLIDKVRIKTRNKYNLEDDLTIIELRKENKTGKEIAEVLNRTAASVAHRMRWLCNKENDYTVNEEALRNYHLNKSK